MKFSFYVLLTPGIKRTLPIRAIWKITSFCGAVLAALPGLPASLAGVDIIQTAG